MMRQEAKRRQSKSCVLKTSDLLQQVVPVVQIRSDPLDHVTTSYPIGTTESPPPI